MRFKFSILFLFLQLSLLHLANSQNLPNSRAKYSLLWKVSGNGLAKPSYLFGTMHVTNEKVFQFSDSVITKIKECENFSLEIAPDSLLKNYFEDFSFDSPSGEDDEDDLKAALGTEDYKKLQTRFKAETGVTLKDLRLNSPKEIIDYLTRPVPGKNDKSTFLDAYLYRIALVEGKSIHGVEDVRSHFSDSSLDDRDYDQELNWFIQNDVSYKKHLDSLTQMYWRGDIEELLTYFSSGSGMSHSKLNARNYKMADAFVELMKDKSTFLAVGCAHLSGKDGLIKILRNKGYKLELVPASFTGMAEQYKEKTYKPEWYKYSSGVHSLEVEFPAKPYEIKQTKILNGIIYMYPDLGTGLFYMMFSLPIPKHLERKQQEEMLLSFAKSMGGEESYKQVKTALKNAKTPDAVFTAKSPKREGDAKFRMMFENSAFKVFMAYGNQEKVLDSPDAHKFFASVKSIRKQAEWLDFTSEEGAFKVSVPFEMKKFYYKASEENNYTAATVFATLDPATNIQYMAGYHLLGSGQVVISDSIYIASIIESFLANAATDPVLKDTLFNGYPAKEFCVVNTDSSIYKGKIVIKGNRPYSAYIYSPPGEKLNPDIDKYLNSFKIIPNKSQRKNEVNSKDYNFSVTLNGPEKFEYDSTSTESFTRVTYTSEDPNSGFDNTVDVNLYSKFYYNSESEFYKEVEGNIFGSEDSILVNKEFLKNGLKGRLYTSKPKDVHMYKKVLLLPAGNCLFMLVAHTLIPTGKDSITDTFFDSFKVGKLTGKENLFTSKTEKIFTALQSKDTVEFQNAKDFLGQYVFEEKDVPLMSKMLNVRFPDDTTQNYSSVKSVILDRLCSFPNKIPYADLAKLFYKNDTLPYVQVKFLETMLYAKTESAVNEFAKLVKDTFPAIDFVPYSLFTPLQDSIELVKGRLDFLIKLSKYDLVRGDVYGLVSSLLDSSLIKSSELTQYLPDIEKSFLQDISRSDLTNNLYRTINLIGYLDDEKCVSMLKRVCQYKQNNWLVLEAAKGLISKNITLSDSVKESLAADFRVRSYFYDYLAEKELNKLFPAKYLKQPLFAVSHLNDYLENNDEYYADSIVITKTKIVRSNGGKNKFYLAKVLIKTEDANYWYAACVGPYSTDKSNVQLVSDSQIYTNWDEYESQSTDKHFQTLLNGGQIAE